MNQTLSIAPAAPAGDSQGADDWRLVHLIKRLPLRMQTAVHWLRRPSSRWARLPAGVLLVFGGLLSILPILGLWMLPLGLALLAEDAPPLRRARGRILDWLERRYPKLWNETADRRRASRAGAAVPETRIHDQRRQGDE
jgi:hypothetical protein